ncbi:uncharacterized protein MELLADRAFT_111072 [Melampsora larici-populina 98AG31]|uniref:Uncharacterized protein n=1 Tax=Melampsora larici-populina (strain 98AG31 / pathotype 3-4-7) TaxID=747676 RepID=F4S1Y6_MELLP|nr:uncharacterized protein MELLADRAFT_111072 [Melampsora larici-populina 98AG31]EGG01271.1 hypothetical protein MELLADRAFT_111072 [Melampsora larici-populina 98AG31]
MITSTNVLLRSMIYSSMWLFSLHTTIAPSPGAVFDSAYDSSSGIAGTRDVSAVTSTIETSGARFSHPQPCRRSMDGCLLATGHHMPSTGTSPASDASRTSEESRITQTLAPPKSWKTSAALNLRRLEGKALMGFFPKIRDDWNLAYAAYEEVLAGAVRWKADWVDTEGLAATLADMSTTRQRSTNILGLSPEVKNYISQERLPQLYQKLQSTLQEELDHLSENGGLKRDIDSKIAILNHLFKLELGDPELGPYLDPLERKLSSLNEQHAPTPETEIPETLSTAKIPPRLSFSAFTRLREQAPKAPNSERIWAKINYQFEAEKNHLEYLRGLNRPILGEWTSIKQLTTDFIAKAGGSAWIGPKFYPQKLKVSEYKTLQEINLQRRALIEHATRVAARPLHDTRLSSEEMKLLRQIELETLMIEGGSEHSDEVREILAGLVNGGNQEAIAFLRQVDIERDSTSNVPEQAGGLDSLRYKEGWDFKAANCFSNPECGGYVTTSYDTFQDAWSLSEGVTHNFKVEDTMQSYKTINLVCFCSRPIIEK